MHRWVLTQGPDGHVVLAQAVRLDVPIIVPAAAAATTALMERRQRYKRMSHTVTRVRELQHLHAPQIDGQELAERNRRPLHEELQRPRHRRHRREWGGRSDARPPWPRDWVAIADATCRDAYRYQL